MVHRPGETPVGVDRWVPPDMKRGLPDVRANKHRLVAGSVGLVCRLNTAWDNGVENAPKCRSGMQKSGTAGESITYGNSLQGGHTDLTVANPSDP